jgi:hypothetical protein
MLGRIAVTVICFLAFSVSVTAQTGMMTMWGPETFVREEGKPEYFERIIDTTGFTHPYVIHIRNGNEMGENRVSTGWVGLNGQILLDPSWFNQQVYAYDSPVVIRGSSVLGVQLSSIPGSQLTVWIEGTPAAPNVRTVDATGGLLEYPSGVILEVPAGAVDGPTAIEIQTLPCETIEPILASRVLLKYPKSCLGVFSAEPSIQFNVPILATFEVRSLTPGHYPVLLSVDLDSSDYVRLDTFMTYDGDLGVATAEIAHFSAIAVAETVAIPEDGCPPGDFACYCEHWYEPGSQNYWICMGTNGCYESESPAECRDRWDRCHTCEWTATDCESFNPDGLQPTCCEIPGVENCGFQCDLNACCKTGKIDVESGEMDPLYTNCEDSQGNVCTIWGRSNSVKFRSCPGQPTEIFPESDSENCANDFKLETTIDAPSPFYVCEAREFSATTEGNSNSTDCKFTFENLIYDWSTQSDVLKLPVREGPSVPVQARKLGPANLKARVPLIPGLEKEITVTVEDPVRNSADNLLELDLGASWTLTAWAAPYCSFHDPCNTNWEIIDESELGMITLVPSTGNITANAVGTATVRGTIDYQDLISRGLPDWCEHAFTTDVIVTVGDPCVPESLEVTPNPVTVKVGEEQALEVVLWDSCGKEVEDPLLEWSLPAESPFGFDRVSHVVTGVAPGTADLIVSTGEVPAVTIQVNVIKDLIVEARTQHCDWGSNYCHLEEFGMPVEVKAGYEQDGVFSGQEGVSVVINPFWGTSVYPYLVYDPITGGSKDSCTQFEVTDGVITMFGCAGTTDANGRLYARLEKNPGVSSKAPFVKASLEAEYGSTKKSLVFRAVTTANWGNCPSPHPSGDPGYPAWPFGWDVGEPSGVASLEADVGFFEGSAYSTAGASGEYGSQGSGGADQEGIWWDKLLFIPKDLSVLDNWETPLGSLNSPWLRVTMGYSNTYSGGASVGFECETCYTDCYFVHSQTMCSHFDSQSKVTLVHDPRYGTYEKLYEAWYSADNSGQGGTENNPGAVTFGVLGGTYNRISVQARVKTRSNASGYLCNLSCGSDAKKPLPASGSGTISFSSQATGVQSLEYVDRNTGAFIPIPDFWVWSCSGKLTQGQP